MNIFWNHPLGGPQYRKKNWQIPKYHDLNTAKISILQYHKLQCPPLTAFHYRTYWAF